MHTVQCTLQSEPSSASEKYFILFMRYFQRGFHCTFHTKYQHWTLHMQTIKIRCNTENQKLGIARFSILSVQFGMVDVWLYSLLG